MSKEGQTSVSRPGSVDFGQLFTPLCISPSDLAQSGKSVREKGYLEGVGEVTIYLEATELQEKGPINIVAKSAAGKLIVEPIKTIPPFKLSVAVNYDSPETIDPNLVCEVVIDDLVITGENMEKENPERAGYAVFYTWQASPEEKPNELLIPPDFVCKMQMRFKKAS